MAVADFQGIRGRLCAKCGGRPFHYMVKNQLLTFVARSDLPKHDWKYFPLQVLGGVDLCMLGETWRKLQGKPGTKNMVAMQIGVVPEGRVIRAPKLPLFKG